MFSDVGTIGCCETDVAQCTWYGNCIEYASMSSCDRLCQQDANTIKW